ncbi:MAG TPA: ABC transporter substrate-binding protein [Thermomicrobiales bacterium]|nr:ABC transporter substrate-binding protein [Thermomicrobiales bacterium]
MIARDLNRPTAPRINRRRLVQTAAALGLAVPTVGRGLHSGRAQAADPKTFLVGTASSASDIDPHSAYDGRSEMVIYGAYEQFMRLKADTTDQYIPLLAESWEANADKSVWTFHLRQGATFHDGSPCDAAAVKASFERLLKLQLGPFNVVARFVSGPAKIATPDPATIVFDLGSPQPMFEAAMAAPYGPYIVNAKLAKTHEVNGDWGHAWMQTNADGMGTGPYRIAQFEPEQQATLEKYDGYWGGWDGAHFERIVIRVVPEEATLRQLIEQGQIDIVDNLTPEATDALAKNPDLRVDRAYTTSDGYVIMTVAGALASVEARQAMAWAFPYDEVIQGVYKGYAKKGSGPLAELCRGYDPQTFVYATDLAKAKDLLAKAGAASGTTLSMMLIGSDEASKQMAQVFAANLQQLGLALDIQAVDQSTFIATAYGDAAAADRPSMFPWFWQPDYNDGWNHLWPQVACDAAFGKGSNAGVYCNAKADALLAQAKSAADPVAYQKALSELQNLISRDDPAGIYYVQIQWTTILRRDIAGFFTNPVATGLYDFYRMSRSGS